MGKRSGKGMYPPTVIRKADDTCTEEENKKIRKPSPVSLEDSLDILSR